MRQILTPLGDSPLQSTIAADRMPVSEADARTTIDVLYRRRYRDVFQYVMLTMGRLADADDIVADVFQRAFVALVSGHEPTGDWLPWLLLVARRIVLNQRRRERIVRWLPLSSSSVRDPAALPDHTAEAEFWSWFESLSKILSARQRDVLILRYHRDLGDDQIGLILGITPSGVRSLASRAISTLRSHPEVWS
jgi:RNA polymerase sigma factor (sigma-70 family)